MNGMMSGMNQNAQNGSVPPPIPGAVYHVAVNGQQTGPFTLQVLSQMASGGELTKDSLVWTNGMTEWAKAGTVDDLKDMFVAPPPVTTE